MFSHKDNPVYGGTGDKTPRIPNIGTRMRRSAFAFEIYDSHEEDYQITIVWYVMPCTVVDIYSRFTWTFCLHHQCRSTRLQTCTHKPVVSILASVPAALPSDEENKAVIQIAYRKWIKSQKKNSGYPVCGVEIQTDTCPMLIHWPREKKTRR
jgi:hypothetical protein